MEAALPLKATTKKRTASQADAPGVKSAQKSVGRLTPPGQLSRGDTELETPMDQGMPAPVGKSQLPQLFWTTLPVLLLLNLPLHYWCGPLRVSLHGCILVVVTLVLFICRTPDQSVGWAYYAEPRRFLITGCASGIGRQASHVPPPHSLRF